MTNRHLSVKTSAVSGRSDYQDLTPAPHELYHEIEVGRIRLLPQEEQGPFSDWLDGQTRPLIDTLDYADQDYFFWSDYLRWRAGLPVID